MNKDSFGISRPVSLKFETLRNFSTLKDQSLKRTIWISQMNTTELIKKNSDGSFLISNNKNVRDYLKSNKTGDNNAKTGVHKSIYDSLSNQPENFNFLNGGVTIVADGCEVDNKNKTITLEKPSIINGTQTRGVLELFHEENPDENISIKVEIIVVLKNKGIKENDDLDIEISIARNDQSAVADLSKEGKRRRYVELQNAVDWDIRQNESQKYLFDTLKLIQLLFLVLPDDMWEKHLKKTAPSRASIYSGKSKWNKEWVMIHEGKDGEYKVVFDFFMQVANQVMGFYLSQKKSNLFKGCGRQISKDSGSYTINKDGTYNIKDGWLFPLISSLSHYVVEVVPEQEWKLQIPKEEKLRGVLALIYNYGNFKELPNVQTLGKTRLAYDGPLEVLIGLKPGQLEEKAKKVFK